jgi:hypothetical protein
MWIMARTPVPIDWKLVDDYLELGATQEEIAESFGLERDQLRRRFKEKHNIDYVAYAAQFKRRGQMQIRRAQFDNAVAGNTQLLLWLGKVLCGQREVESVQNVAPNQSVIDSTHENMLLKARVEELEKKLDVVPRENRNEPKTEQELCGSDTPVQHLDRSSPEREDLF